MCRHLGPNMVKWEGMLTRCEGVMFQEVFNVFLASKSDSTDVKPYTSAMGLMNAFTNGTRT